MKIAFILTTCDNFGPFLVARDIINYCRDQSIHFDVFYLKETDFKLKFNAKYIKVGLFSHFDFSKYDVVHSHGFLADVYAFRNRASIKNRVSTLHQDIKTDYGMKHGIVIASVHEWVWCYLLRHNKKIVTLSRQMQLYYKSKFKNNLTFIHNGMSPKSSGSIDRIAIEKILELKKNHCILGISASLIYRKGIDIVIKALALPGGEKFGLVILGEGELSDKLTSLSKELKINDRCLFLGHKKNGFDYYKFFDMYVMSSRSEGFGLCVIEAAASSLPIVCNDLPIYHELFSNEEVSYYEKNDPNSLLESLKAAYNQKDSLAKNVNMRYKKDYTAEVMSSKYVNLYRNLLHETK